MESTDLIVGLCIFFIVIGAASSLVYYFARYYIKTDHEDQELITKKPKSLNEALANTRQNFWGRISQLATKSNGLNLSQKDELEEILYTSDMGANTAEVLLSQLQQNFFKKSNVDLQIIKQHLRDQMLSFFKTTQEQVQMFEKIKMNSKPTVWMVVGVNGAGKTTTIGKLASLAQKGGLKTIIVAGDTFRAAADSQLKVWAERAGCEIFTLDNTKDPGAVAYAGVERAKATHANLVIVDTAGRLHTQDHLMEELKKIKRVMGKLDAEAPHERILVIDANAGQNALVQARQFHEAVSVSRIIVTKMDGSSKAGVVAGIAHELKIPVAYVGVGESVDDLRPFYAEAFVEAII